MKSVVWRRKNDRNGSVSENKSFVVTVVNDKINIYIIQDYQRRRDQRCKIRFVFYEDMQFLKAELKFRSLLSI